MKSRKKAGFCNTSDVFTTATKKLQWCRRREWSVPPQSINLWTPKTNHGHILTTNKQMVKRCKETNPHLEISYSSRSSVQSKLSQYPSNPWKSWSETCKRNTKCQLHIPNWRAPLKILSLSLSLDTSITCKNYSSIASWNFIAAFLLPVCWGSHQTVVLVLTDNRSSFGPRVGKRETILQELKKRDDTPTSSSQISDPWMATRLNKTHLNQI